VYYTIMNYLRYSVGCRPARYNRSDWFHGRGGRQRQWWTDRTGGWSRSTGSRRTSRITRRSGVRWFHRIHWWYRSFRRSWIPRHQRYVRQWSPL